MKLQVKVNVPLNIRMCLECPFYDDRLQPVCFANNYISKDELNIRLDCKELDVIPDKCPLLKLEDEEEVPLCKYYRQQDGGCRATRECEWEGCYGDRSKCPHRINV